MTQSMFRMMVAMLWASKHGIPIPTDPNELDKWYEEHADILDPITDEAVEWRRASRNE